MIWGCGHGCGQPDKEPEFAASSVETLNNLRASSTWLSRANGDKLIFARDSDILITASNCLKYRNIKRAVDSTMSCDPPDGNGYGTLL